MSYSLQDLVAMNADVRLIHAHIIDYAEWGTNGITYSVHNINHRDKNGRTALDIAIEKGNKVIIRILKQYGGKLGAEIG